MIETKLYPPIEKKFSEEYNIFHEVRLYCRRVDMLMISKKTKKPEIAMEFKLKDWKTAIQQANSYQLIADYSYIVLYYKNIYKIEKQLDILEKKGIGLISASTRRFEILLYPIKKKFFDKELWKKIKKDIQEGKYKNE